jgi:hypothetical protein
LITVVPSRRPRRPLIPPSDRRINQDVAAVEGFAGGRVLVIEEAGARL